MICKCTYEYCDIYANMNVYGLVQKGMCTDMSVYGLCVDMKVGDLYADVSMYSLYAHKCMCRRECV